MGNRIAKHVLTNTGVEESATYYVRDAQGNIMTTYLKTAPNQTMSYQVEERRIYGSSRLGIYGEKMEMIGATVSTTLFNHLLGKRELEGVNHLGNVLTVFSDRKFPQNIGGDVSGFKAELFVSQDYYSFGMLMPGRTFSSDGYRFGFNGQENDDEIHGKGNHYEFKYRMHDSRLGRFLSVDPLTSKFAYNSPYAFAENRVIDGMELEGLEVVLVGKQEAANVIVGGSAEVGVIIAPDGVYAYGSTAVGLATTVSVSSSISLTFYPTMPEAQNASGWGWNAGVGFGEVVVGSVNLAQSSGFYGVNVTVGVGGGLAPIEGHAYASYTAIKPLSEDARMATMGILEQAKFGLQSKIESLTSDALKLSSENNVLSTENAILKRQLKGANGNLHNELTDKININNQKYWSNYKEINEKKADIKNLSAADQEIEGAINQLKSKDQK